MQPQRIIVKLGTSTLTAGTSHLNRQRMLEIVQQLARLHQSGHEVIVVSSGAQAAGRERLQFPELSRSVPAKQMLSAVGQSRLMRIYSDLFDIFEVIVAQVLLTHDDLNSRARYINARDTLYTLLDHRIVPIINENDTVATQEIRVGDNDNLSAMVATAVEADLLILLTDQQGLFTADPRRDVNARKIDVVPRISAETFALAGGAGSKGGTGGMITKLQAAQIATRSGVPTVIASGSEADVLGRIVAGEGLGTRFEPTASHLESRKRWMLTGKAQGTVQIDAGAARALLAKDGASLLPVGIRAISGDFDRGAKIAVHNLDGLLLAHGLSAYSSAALEQIKGEKSNRIQEILGYSYGDAAIHRNNLIVLVNGSE
jgi:glutamate 5-kinase